MTNFIDLKRRYFAGQQSIFSDIRSSYDYERAALSQALSIGLIQHSEVPDRWKDFFFTIGGFPNAYSTNLSDLWFDFLGNRGFTQSSLRQRLKAFYESGQSLTGD